MFPHLFSILYPRTCAMCGGYIGDTTSVLCDACLRSLPLTEQDMLLHNSTEMAVAGQPSDLVAAMKTMHLRRAAAYLFFEKEHPVQDMIHRMKFADQPLIGYQLGRQAALAFLQSDFFDEIDVIIPMPLHPKRLRERGYNQSEYIARGISDVIGCPVDTTHVTRIRHTHQQALQRGDERHHNVADAFAVNHPEQLYHCHILLVDDLITTGETIRSCMRAMRLFRGAAFTVFALCKAR